MSELSFSELRRHLAEVAKDDPQQPPHARAFAGWIQHKRLDQVPTLRALATDTAALEGAARQTAHVAVLGYAAHLDPAYREPFAGALDWLLQRQYFAAGRPLTFEIDGLALLGTAVGILGLENTTGASARAWLEGLTQRSLALGGALDWNKSLITAAYGVLGNSASGAEIADDLRTALAAKGLLPSTAESQATAWEIISELTGLGDGMTRAAAQLAAVVALLQQASPVRFGSASVDNVAGVLKGVERSMRRWVWDNSPRTPRSLPAHWEIENEYHVQDLLWVILAPLFPDLDDEEWLKSLGQHRPRADLAIPSLSLIVEVKFLRPGGRSVFSGVVKEVAADASTYLQDGSGYHHIIAFVWDDVARTEEHAELRQGLTRIRGVRDAIVLSRPSIMDRSYRGGANRASAGDAPSG